MADYYPLIARAIAGLDPSAPGESRRALYERARGGARAGDAFRATTRPTARPGEPAPPPSASPRPPVPPQARNERPPLGQEERQDQRPQRNLRADAPRPPPSSQPQVPMQDPQLPPTRERSGAPRRGSDNSAPQAPGARGFRDIAADADDLGRAAAQASRSARKTYANVSSPSPEFDRLEPNMENRGADPDAPYSYDESAAEADRYGQPPPQPPSRSRL